METIAITTRARRIARALNGERPSRAWQIFFDADGREVHRHETNCFICPDEDAGRLDGAVMITTNGRPGERWTYAEVQEILTPPTMSVGEREAWAAAE